MHLWPHSALRLYSDTHPVGNCSQPQQGGAAPSRPSLGGRFVRDRGHLPNAASAGTFTHFDNACGSRSRSIPLCWTTRRFRRGWPG